VNGDIIIACMNLSRIYFAKKTDGFLAESSYDNLSLVVIRIEDLMNVLLTVVCVREFMVIHDYDGALSFLWLAV